MGEQADKRPSPFAAVGHFYGILVSEACANATGEIVAPPFRAMYLRSRSDIYIRLAVSSPVVHWRDGVLDCVALAEAA